MMGLDVRSDHDISADFPHEDVELFDPNELFDLNEDTDPDTSLNF